MSVTVTARLTEEMAAKLDTLAQHTKRSKSYLVAEAIEQYAKRELAFVEAVLEGIASADRGELIEHDEMMKRLYARIDEVSRRKSEAAE